MGKSNHFKIIVPFYNVEKWIKVCIRSLKAQTHTNFQCVLIDDLSTDSTEEIIKKEISGDERFALVRPETKSYALKNIYEGIAYSKPDAEDIIVTLDGDDWLAGPDVLKILNDRYNETDCWITYGSYAEYPSGTRGKFARQIPPEFITTASLRKQPWMSSHMRTFKYALWTNIKKRDLLDSEGNFYRMAWDLAFMFPMLEMAGLKSQYIEDILYIYNVSNPLNDHKVDNTYQRELEHQIRSKAPYNRRDLTGVAAHHLLTPLRYDVAAKTLYGRHRAKGVKCDWAKELYLEHLHVWNNFNEASPPKSTPEEFVNAFDSILDSFKKNGFIDTPENHIPLAAHSPLNGAHRIASGIVYDVPVVTCGPTPHGRYDCSAEYFRNKDNFVKTGLTIPYLDAMALEYIRHRDKTRIATLFPRAGIDATKAMNILAKHCEIVYHKTVELNALGAHNYIHTLYKNEPWLGNAQNNYPGAHEKKAGCFDEDGEIVVFLVDRGTPESLRSAKEEIREICGIGNHSIHINDTYAETWTIATSVFNENSIHWLNHSTLFQERYGRFLDQFTRYFEWIATSNDRVHLDIEDMCVDASSTLSVYGLRQGRDLDFLYHAGNITTNLLDINCHNLAAGHYNETIDEIIYDPTKHFYFNGLKFASLQVVRNMKTNRGEEKDKKDVTLIDGVLNA